MCQRSNDGILFLLPMELIAARRPTAWSCNPDVRFSLGPYEGLVCQPAAVTVHEIRNAQRPSGHRR